MLISTPNNKRILPMRMKRQSDRGFSLLEMVIALSILTIGLLGVAAAIGYAFTVSNHGRKITNSKLLVASVLEQMETLRDTGELTFGQIANPAQVDNTGADIAFAGFPTGFQTVSNEPGPDGIFGTADDLSTSPGADGVYGTADDTRDLTRAVPDATREIVIGLLSGSTTLKRIQVTVHYTANGKTYSVDAVSYLNDDAHSNYVP